MDHDFFRVWWKKSSELLFSNHGDQKVKSYPHKGPFSEDHISAPKGCCTPRFLYTLENEQILLVHLPPGSGVHLENFFKEGQKLA